MWRCCENFSPLKYALSSTLLPCCRFSSHFKAPFSSHCHGKGGGAAAGARNEKLRVFIVAGEPSGDLIGSRLMASLRRLSPRPLQFAGVGGNLMKREGLVSEFPMEDIAVMGVAELLPHLVRIWVRLLLMIVVTDSIFSLSLSMDVLKEMDCLELILCSNCKW
jgi:hypothetical protein